jgi:Fe-S cluster biogenesis protein NfuA
MLARAARAAAGRVRGGAAAGGAILPRSAFPSAFLGAARSMYIEAHPTPNINSLKFHPGKPVLPHGTMDFPNARAGLQSPLAQALFRVDGVASVFFGMDFVTVTKADDELSWAELKPEIFAAIMDFYASGAPVMTDEANMPGTTTVNEDDSEVVQLIKELLDTRIRPAVQDDGGDINFVSFDEETGVVVVQLQGACSTCSSSKVTLKSGVENMLKHYVPEVHEVIAEDLAEDDNDPVTRRQREFMEEMQGHTYKTPAC